mmetsp:Transcript_19031/g.28761  ORF Transcript_19031/g.28761 Transcript_19031/m.28761 type:complete len:937 (-) Transcript_19031:350-3160(-)
MSRAEAIPLITQEESGKYIVSSEAVEVLSYIEAPLAVVAIAGLWRTGKSYLLNHLSGAQERHSGDAGFQVGATVNACTKGLWLWGEPVKLEDGLTVLFVDTEGLGSTSRTQTEDSQIFSLALLLSSMFVWNSRGVIDGNALEDFALVVNLTKHIHVRSNAATKATTTNNASLSSSSSPSQTPKYIASNSGNFVGGGGSHELEALAEHFPSFMWVVRDFTLRLEDGGRKINDRQYLENALKPQQSFSSEAASRNQIRTLLSSFFRERDCITLVRPAEEESTLRNLRKVPFHELRPEFQQGMHTLKNKVYASLRPKALNGRALTGPMLATLAETYVDALNSGGIPTISTAWDRVLQSQAAEAVTKALAGYDEYIAQLYFGLEKDLGIQFLSDRRGIRAVAAESFQLNKKSAMVANNTQEEDDAAAEIIALAVPGFPIESIDCDHDAAAAKAENIFVKAVWASDGGEAQGRDDSSQLLMEALRERRGRLGLLNELASRKSCRDILDKLLLDPRIFARPGYKSQDMNYLDSLRAELAEFADDDDENNNGTKVRSAKELKRLYLRDLTQAAAWLEELETKRCAALLSSYNQQAVGPAKWEVFTEHGIRAILQIALEWANELGLRHRSVSKLVRSRAARLEEKHQTVKGEHMASEVAVQRELNQLERAASDSRVTALAAVQALDAQLIAKQQELERHAAATERLSAAYEFATSLVEQQQVLQKELFDDMKRVLNTIRNAGGTTADENDGPDEMDQDEDDEQMQDVNEELGAKRRGLITRTIFGSGRDSRNKKNVPSKPKNQHIDWDAADLGFEREEMAEFAPLNLSELKERIGEDEKELELMHEHAALTIEHARVKKMLLADKDHELQEYEYQWGVAKANVAASEGELMVVDEEVAVLRGTILQMHRYLESTSRTGKLPNDIYRSLSRDQRALLDELLTSPS